jgi:nitrogen fixation protein FixH
MTKNFYPALIIFLLGTFILFLVWSGFQASTQGTQVTDRDYYSKGLKYNSTQIEKRAASAMGWKLSPQLVDGELLIDLQDGKGQPVAAAKGLLHLYSRPGIDLLKLPLQEVEAGRYRTRLPAELTGEVTIRIEFERDGARINRQLLITI